MHALVLQPMTWKLGSAGNKYNADQLFAMSSTFNFKTLKP